MTAEDVVFSFTRMLSKDAVTAGPLGSILKGAKEYQDGSSQTVKGLRIKSPQEVEFSLVRPDALGFLRGNRGLEALRFFARSFLAWESRGFWIRVCAVLR